MPEDDKRDPITGLPEDLGIEEDLGRTEQRVRIRIEKRRYDKPVTVVEGFDQGSVDLKSLASDLKSKLATGGTVTDDAIELQGNHRDRAESILDEKGYAVE